MLTGSYTTRFWERLREVRLCSRRLLVALEEDDVDEVERLSRDAEELLAELKPVIEERLRTSERSEDDEMLGEMLSDLAAMNGRILEELAERTERVRRDLAEVRENRLRLTHFRAHDRNGARLDEVR